MKNIALSFLLGLLFFGSYAFSKPGDVISVEKLTKLSKSFLDDYQKTQNLEFPEGGADPLFDVNRYKVIYETTDINGNATHASGVLLVPESKSKAFPLISYQHGTTLKRIQAPSSENSGEQLLVAIGIASRGFVVSMPDYLGLGENLGMHPYHHSQSEATASVDMLRAVRTLREKLNLNLSHHLFLAGYSQGGHATFALQRHIEQHLKSEFTITASAPQGGAYDGVAAFEELLESSTKNTPIELVYLVLAMQTVYKNIGSIDQIFAKNYQWVEQMFDGNWDWDTAWKAFQEEPKKIFNPEFLKAFHSNSNHPLRLALRENSFPGFKVIAPTYLMYGDLDKEVPFSQSLELAKRLKAAGSSDVHLISVPGDHAAASRSTMLESVRIFRKLLN
jgi:pimeloyl-ACP methyl ester carboxylesterase